MVEVGSIADHGLLSNCRGAALVDRDGTIDWACLPRFDSPASFSALLDPDAGHWSLRPSDPDAASSRRYLPGTMVVATTWRTSDGGEVEVHDLLALGRGERGHEIGRGAPPAILRVVEGRRGRVELTTELAVRPEYGLVTTRVRPARGGAVASGGSAAYAISAPVELGDGGRTGAARFSVGSGERLAFELRLGDPWTDAPQPRPQGEVLADADDTVEAWRSWSELHEGYDGPFRDLVVHSGRLLQALTHAPTGAVVAAPTTSLPEAPGASRNWDYRYSWARDAAMTLEALWVAACPDEAELLFRFFATAGGADLDDGRPLPVLHGVGGERHLPEVELTHLRGHEGSRPVRIGNGAWQQRQLDVYGELLSAAARLADEMGDLDEETAAFLVSLADGAAAHWHEPDHGIWEARGEPQHVTYSKLMCWVALDRALALADTLGAADRREHWEAVRDEIREAITERCWNDELGAYTDAYGSDRLDASVLMMLIVGFLDADDPRARSTVDAVAGGLTDDHGFVYRYRHDDGLDGDEGTFTICTCWLAHCRAMLGQVDEARRLLEAVAARANDLGLLAEELDPRTGQLRGNFPQAFTHIGLVNAAWALHEAEQRESAEPGTPSVAIG